MIMQNKLELDYHVNRMGESDSFCDLLTCYDQICYFEFRKVSDFNRWVYFCDDINLKIDDSDQVSVMRTMVNREYQRLENNPSIVKVRKEGFAEAFEKCCEVYILKFEDLPVKREEEAVLLEKNIRKVIQNYDADLKDAYAGRKAYEYMRDQCELDHKSIFMDSFPYHIMTSRRLLLKKSLQRWRDVIRNYALIMKYLDQSVEFWRQMKLISSDYQYLKIEPSRRAKEQRTSEHMMCRGCAAA